MDLQLMRFELMRLRAMNEVLAETLALAVAHSGVHASAAFQDSFAIMLDAFIRKVPEGMQPEEWRMLLASHRQQFSASPS